MKKNRIRMYWLLLLTLVFTASILMSVGTSQARYIHTATSVAVVGAPEGVTSNCLVTADDAPRTVLLGQIEPGEVVKIPFWMLSSSSDATAELDWGVADKSHAKYLDINVLAGHEILEPEEDLELLENIRLDMALRITPTEKALTLSAPLKITVHVTWGTGMWGTFQVMLPAMVDPTEPTEETTEETTEPATEATTEEATEPATEATTEETTEPATEAATEETTEPATEDTTEEATEPATEASTEETTEPATEATTEETIEPETEESTEEATEPATEAATEETTEPATEATTEETTEPATEATTEEATEPATEEATEPTTEPATEETTEPTTEPETEAPTEAESESAEELAAEKEAEALIELKTISSFNPEEKLPVLMKLADHITSVRLGIRQTYGEITCTEKLPDYTMFSVDGGNSYYMVYGDYLPEFGLQDVTEIPLLMDFRYAQLDTETEITLAMEAWKGEELRKTCTADATPNATKSGQVTVRTESSEIQTVWEDAVTATQVTSPILTPDNALEFPFPIEWEDSKLKYTVELLTMTEENVLKYVPVELTREGLYATYYKDDTTHRLVLRLGETYVQPGTYRINMTWEYEGVCYSDTQTTFFVNYPAQTSTVQSSQEVPNDD